MRLKAMWLYACGCSYITIKLAILSHNSLYSYVAAWVLQQMMNPAISRAQFSLIATLVFLLQDIRMQYYLYNVLLSSDKTV